MADLIYLDAAASSPLAPEALAATVAALAHVGNPGAAHAAGYESSARVDAAREQIASLMDVGPASVIFVGSATEANNLALRGLALDRVRNEIVTTAAEHPSVLATVQAVVSEPRDARVVCVASTGEVDLDRLQYALSSRTAIVSIHAANNETGVIQPLEAIAQMAHDAGALVHADASQLMAWGRTSLLDECDLVTVSSHKMHGPQGAAALIVRRSARGSLRAQVTGGGQEHGLRSGTVNVAAVAGFGAAAELALASGRESALAVSALRTMLIDGLRARVGDVIEHAAEARRRLPGILNVALGATWPDGAESEALLARLPMLAASTGSACHSGAPEPSPVLLAMGISRAEASRSIRLSLSRYTTAADIREAVEHIGRGYAELARLLDAPESVERYAK